MNTKPILFSTEMVIAILSGRKTQTRRLVNLDTNQLHVDETEKFSSNYFSFKSNGEFVAGRKTPYNIGDVLWVRETFIPPLGYGTINSFIYKTDPMPPNARWKPSIHMPKKACRLFLKIISIKTERLQAISEKDALAEGFRQYEKETDWMTAKFGFQTLWEDIYGYENWKNNPFVWVIEFKQIEKPKEFSV